MNVVQDVFHPPSRELEAGEHVAQPGGEVALEVGRERVVKVPVQKIGWSVPIHRRAAEGGHVRLFQQVGNLADVRDDGNILKISGMNIPGQVHHHGVSLQRHEHAFRETPGEKMKMITESRHRRRL